MFLANCSMPLLDRVDEVADEGDRVLDDHVEGVADLLDDADDLQADRPGDQHRALEDELEDLLADRDQEVEQPQSPAARRSPHIFSNRTFGLSRSATLKASQACAEQRLDAFPGQIELA